jgi:allophanate hydrolase
MYRLEELKEKTLPVWQAIDFLLLPTAGWIYKIAEVEAEPIKLNSNLGYYTNFVNLLDLAALAIPAGHRDDGLPFGVTLIAPAMTDRSLLADGGPFNGSAGRGRRCPFDGAAAEQPVDRARSKASEILQNRRDYRLFALANTQPSKPGLCANAVLTVRESRWKCGRSRLPVRIFRCPNSPAPGNRNRGIGRRHPRERLYL